MSPTHNSSRSIENGWRRVFERFKLDPTADIIELTSKQLNEVRDEGLAPDARLMVKFDSREKLPLFLRELGYFIVPVTNGRYALLRGDGYCDLPQPLEPLVFTTPFAPLTVGGTSRAESSRLNFAFNSGLLEHHFKLSGLSQTFTGKGRSPRFDFYYKSIGPIEVNGVQVEIDGGYQANSDALVLEAKMGTPASFNVRQLYFPLRSLTTTQPRLSVQTGFVSCDRQEDVFHFWNVEFPEPTRYDSARIAGLKSYRVRVGKPAPEAALISSTTSLAEPSTAREQLVPQADTLELVAQIPFVIRAGHSTSAQIAHAIRYVGRQGHYYPEAAAALGLVKKAKGRDYELTDLGQRFTSLSAAARTELLIGLVLQTKVVQEVLASLSPTGVSQSDIAEVIRRHSRLTGSTPKRRAGSVMRWLVWVGERTGLFEKKAGRLFRR